MEQFEFQGKNTEEAVEKACRELNIPKDEMEIEVVEPGSAGIFGLMGGRKTKIRVTLHREDPVQEEEHDGLGIAKDVLENILKLIPVEGTDIRAEKNDGNIVLKIEGDSSGLLIGKKGKTLDALQFIVNKIVNRLMGKRLQVIVDSEGYRERRQDHLIQMAMKLGDKARRIMKPVSTELLNPNERRIVHLALKDEEGLDTKSRGEGHLKKVLIIPKR